MNPKAGEDGSWRPLPQESPEAGSRQYGKAESIDPRQYGEGRKQLGSGVPEALKPGSSRCWPGQHSSSAAARESYLCGRGCSGRGQQQGRSDGIGELEARGGRPWIRRLRLGEPARVGSQRPARVQWLAEPEEPRALKGALTFLGFPLTNGRPRGRKREGASLGSSPPPLPGAQLSS